MAGSDDNVSHVKTWADMRRWRADDISLRHYRIIWQSLDRYRRSEGYVHGDWEDVLIHLQCFIEDPPHSVGTITITVVR